MKIHWYFNESPITTIENGIHVVMTSSRISQLTIEAVTAYHRGIYKCVAESRAGRAEHSSELRVNGISTENQRRIRQIRYFPRISLKFSFWFILGVCVSF